MAIIMEQLIDTSLGTEPIGRLNVRPIDLRGRRPLQTARQLIQSTRMVRRLAFWLSVLLVLAAIALLWLPWQQTALGAGRVIAFSPMERPQEILAPSKGIVVNVPDYLMEGSRVKKGDRLLTIQPTAENLEDQLQRSLDDLRNKLQATERIVGVYKTNIDGYASARDSAVLAANEALAASEAKLQGKIEEVVGYQAKVLQSQRAYDRQRELYRQGIKPLKEIEKLEQELDTAKADLMSVNEAVKSATSDVENKRAERDQKKFEAQTKVESARGVYEKAIGDAASIQKEMRETEIKQSSQSRMYVTAPRDGVIHRLPLVEGGQLVKEGSYLLTIVPDTTELCVEMTVLGIDLPLVRVGNHVRLQFEGWPSLQFSGWPAVAVGTFGGQVAVIDPTSDSSGMFRVLIRPEPEERPWPDGQYLRPGLRANGWVMLGIVPLGYELWRRINGFPPSVDSATGEKDGQISSGKKEKLSKPPLPK